MAVNRAGKSAVVLSSVPLQLLLYLSALYYVFYFLSTFCMIIYKSVRGNLQETEGYIWVNLAMTAATALLSVYFLVWQLYVMHADVIINSILLSVYGLGGVFGLVTLARFTSVYS
ncbi:transmembrane protein 80-like isoform X2 [Coregonus clupeaformis]|uniref:transmembrane protein 80-like isoform X2 n=1 Tax=Coregonus clupeaformis TaxID=59861 RepID=UPI001BDFB947|nr:transmembrane protein 80-like isoform X2 [Coregonus clupeaformis]